MKLQKPGTDLYAYIATVQVIMCIFIIIYYPEMDAEHSSIVS